MNDEQFLEGISNTTHRQNGGTVHMCGLLVIIRQDGSVSLVEAPKQRVERAWRTVGSAHGQASKRPADAGCAGSVNLSFNVTNPHAPLYFVGSIPQWIERNVICKY